MVIKKHSITDLLLYAATIAIAITVKIFYSGSEVGQLVFILKPVSKAVELFLGMPFQFSPDSGFRNLALGVVIGKSCAGLNYFIVLFFMLVFSFTGVIKKAKDKFIAYFVFFFSSYIITIFVNSFRIIAAIYFMDLGTMSAEAVHRSIGILFYLFFLILTYFAVKKIITGVSIENEALS